MTNTQHMTEDMIVRMKPPHNFTPEKLAQCGKFLDYIGYVEKVTNISLYGWNATFYSVLFYGHPEVSPGVCAPHMFDCNDLELLIVGKTQVIDTCGDTAIGVYAGVLPGLPDHILVQWEGEPTPFSYSPSMWAELRLIPEDVPVTAKVQEAPCPGCGRANDVGVKSCWCCGGHL